MRVTPIFDTDYWTESSSRVDFFPGQDIDGLPITAVKIFATRDGKLLLTQVGRGWDLPGGHIEPRETPIKTLKRELLEEADATVGRIEAVGYFRITNDPLLSGTKYPLVSKILIYKGTDITLRTKKYMLNYEATERMLVPFDKIKNFHHNWSTQKQQILNYVLGN